MSESNKWKELIALTEDDPAVGSKGFTVTGIELTPAGRDRILLAIKQRDEEIELLKSSKTEGEWEQLCLAYIRHLHAETRDVLRLNYELIAANREIEVLRLYGNKTCTAMADEALKNER